MHTTYNTAINNYIKLKIETLEWFLDLLDTTTKKNEKEQESCTNRILDVLINDRIRYYEKEKMSRDLEMEKMVEYNDRIKCLESLSIILVNYEIYNFKELISIFD